MAANLERAIQLATEAHASRQRFDGSPYIEHPLRVMKTLQIQGHSERAQIVGVLHDAIEDSDLTLEALRAEGFTDAVLVPLGLLTNQDGADYQLYIGGSRPTHAPARSKRPTCSTTSI